MLAVIIELNQTGMKHSYSRIKAALYRIIQEHLFQDSYSYLMLCVHKTYFTYLMVFHLLMLLV